jgi:hypothetical protein
MGSRAGIVIAALLLATACSDRGRGGEDQGPVAVASDAGTGQETGSGPGDQPRTDRPAPLDLRCRQRQQRTVEELSWRIGQAVDRVSLAPAGLSATASSGLGRQVRVAGDRLRAACDTVPPAALRFVAITLRQTRRPLDAAASRRILTSFAPWADRVSRNSGTDLIAWQHQCREVRRLVTAGYAVWWDHTAEGRDWWLQIKVDNRTADKLLVTLGGSLWADGVPSRYRSPEGPDEHWGREADQYWWGGSSADEIYAPARRATSTFVGIGEFYKVHLLAHGSFFDIRPEVTVSPLRGRRWGACALAVPRLN